MPSTRINEELEFHARGTSVHTKVAAPTVASIWAAGPVRVCQRRRIAATSGIAATADALVNYTGFAIVLFSGIAVLALFVLRQREPAAERPFAVWGYPFVPGLYVLVSAAILINGLYRAPGPTGAGVLVLLAGIPLFLLFSRRSAGRT